MQTPDSDLMRIFDFTAADLKANRAGKMSEGQLQTLKTQVLTEHQMMKRIVIVVPVIAAIVCLLTFPSSIVQIRLQASGIILAITFVATIVGIGYFYLGTSDRKSDLKNLRVEVSVGKAYLCLHSLGKKFPLEYKSAVLQPYGYEIRVAGMDFLLSRRIGGYFEDYYLKLGENTEYRFYYLPNSRKLLSVEIVSE